MAQQWSVRWGCALVASFHISAPIGLASLLRQWAELVGRHGPGSAKGPGMAELVELRAKDHEIGGTSPAEPTTRRTAAGRTRDSAGVVTMAIEARAPPRR